MLLTTKFIFITIKKFILYTFLHKVTIIIIVYECLPRQLIILGLCCYLLMIIVKLMIIIIINIEIKIFCIYNPQMLKKPAVVTIVCVYNKLNESIFNEQ